jgi:uncharacterized membrane protein
MLDLLARIVGMLVLRPYVFLFFAVYLVAAVSKMGWKKAAVFTLMAYGVAFVAEFSSTRTGIPFGLYHYVDTTRDRELWISNVPFWDSLSFSLLAAADPPGGRAGGRHLRDPPVAPRPGHRNRPHDAP